MGVTLGGVLFADDQLGAQISEDLGRAEMLAFPLLILLSIFFFRGGRAAILPLVIGASTVLTTFLMLRVVDEFKDLSIFCLNLVIGMGLGLAIDYTLFLLHRYREELERSGPGAKAVRDTMATAGRTVVFSALTVAIALATLLLFPLNFLQSMAIGGAGVAIVAALASCVIAPAFFALWNVKLRGPRADRAGRRALVRHRQVGHAPAGHGHRGHRAGHGHAGAARAARHVDAGRHPDPARGPERADGRRRAGAGLPGPGQQPGAAGGRGRSRRRRAGARAGRAGGARAGHRIGAAPRAAWTIRRGRSRRLRRATPPASRCARRSSRSAPTTCRCRYWWAARRPSSSTSRARSASALVPALLMLAALTFALLWLMTGSVVLPVKALLMNVLTVGATLGVLTLVFQDGRLEGLLGYTGNGGIEPTDFLVTATLVFALSTDYGVFLLGRIKEARDRGLSDREAVASGLSVTGSVVTAAAILLAVAIGVFVTSEVLFIKQIGLGVAVGVLIDAFVVRALLVPSLMALLGPWNWWSPKPLRWLHERVNLEEPVAVQG